MASFSLRQFVNILIQEFRQYKITFILIGVNILMYLVTMFVAKNMMTFDTRSLADLGALFGPFTVLRDEWWRLLTAMFLHGGMTHLLMNMFSLYIIGRSAELYFDTKSYLSIYFFSGFIGGLISLYVHPVAVGVGASGAIFGVFGALAGFFLAHRDKIASHTKAFMKQFAIIIGVNLALGFAIESVDVSAHLGGLVVGFIGGYVLSKNKKFLIPYVVVMVSIMLGIASYLPSLYVQEFF